MEPLFSISSFVFNIFNSFSWLLYIAPPLILAFLVKDTILFYAQSKYVIAIDWTVIEIRIPRLIEKGPKAMEQFFNSLYGVRNVPGDWKDTYVDGEVTRWFSFEITSVGGRTRLFMRVPTKLKEVVEAMLFGHYGDIELYEVEDYVNQMPNTFAKIQSVGYDIAGVELALAEKSGFPLATYEVFESKEGDERIVDPMSVLLEMFSKLKPDEIVWMQFIVSPADPNWRKEGPAIVEKMRKDAQKKQSESEIKGMIMRSPGEDLKMKLIERKSGQSGFDTMIRYVYFAKSINKDFAYRGLVGYFNQFSSDMNYIRKNVFTWTRLKRHSFPWLYFDQRLNKVKEKMLAGYRDRNFFNTSYLGRLISPKLWFSPVRGRQTGIFSSEELATVYHLPTDVVLTAPTMERIESKRVPPPSNLPT